MRRAALGVLLILTCLLLLFGVVRHPSHAAPAGKFRPGIGLGKTPGIVTEQDDPKPLFND